MQNLEPGPRLHHRDTRRNRARIQERHRLSIFRFSDGNIAPKKANKEPRLSVNNPIAALLDLPKVCGALPRSGTSPAHNTYRAALDATTSLLFTLNTPGTELACM